MTATYFSAYIAATCTATIRDCDDSGFDLLAQHIVITDRQLHASRPVDVRLDQVGDDSIHVEQYARFRTTP